MRKSYRDMRGVERSNIQSYRYIDFNIEFVGASAIRTQLAGAACALAV
ncbi:hypothetical protein [Paenibacillus woosongensis]|nr:hypothetical protein [Paenibacillus woosongensis]